MGPQNKKVRNPDLCHLTSTGIGDERFVARLMLLFNVHRLFSTRITNCNLVIKCSYQPYILASEVKNSAKVMLLIFSRTDVSLYVVIIWEMTFLKRDSAVGLFARVIWSQDCKLKLQVD